MSLLYNSCGLLTLFFFGCLLLKFSLQLCLGLLDGSVLDCLGFLLDLLVFLAYEHLLDYILIGLNSESFGHQQIQVSSLVDITVNVDGLKANVFFKRHLARFVARRQLGQ